MTDDQMAGTVEMTILSIQLLVLSAGILLALSAGMLAAVSQACKSLPLELMHMLREL